MEKMLHGAKAQCEGKKLSKKSDQNEGLKRQAQVIFVIFTSCLRNLQTNLYYFTRLDVKVIVVPSQNNTAY